MEPWTGLWPTIGLQCCDWIEAELVHGPGPVIGQSVKLTEEEVNFICQMYEVHPKGLCGRKFCDCFKNLGAFRYEWAIYCRLKGARKSELAAWLTHLELYGPCRFGGWDSDGDPVAVRMWDLGGTADIPFAATSSEQSKDTAWSSFYEIAKGCSYVDDLDINLEKISVQRNGSGNARVVTASSVRSDGGRPTFTVEEEVHLWIERELKELHEVLDRNLGKLGQNDPHGLKVSTMFAVGEDSVLENDYDSVQEGADSYLLDIRSAPDGLDPKSDEDIMRGIESAMGDATWIDPYRYYKKFKKNPRSGVRYWWNKRSTVENAAVSADEWRGTNLFREVPKGEPICLGFDGSLYEDSTALIATAMEDGYQWPILIFYPDGSEQGVIEMRNAFDIALMQATTDYKLVRMYADPPHWGEYIAKWQNAYGDKVVIPLWTNRDLQMSWATHRWYEGIVTKTWYHSPDETFAKQVIAARRRNTAIIVDVEEGVKGWVPKKDRPNSPNKIDAETASILSYEARVDSIRLRLSSNETKSRKVYSFRR
jgi:hypothetical protein